MRKVYVCENLLRWCCLLFVIAGLLLPSASFAAEFVKNGALLRALPGGARCETSSSAFAHWTLTPENGGGTNYSDDEFWADTRLCGCTGVPCQIYPEISQVFAVGSGGPYTFTWEQRNDQEDCSSRPTMWQNMTAIGTVYYFKDAALTIPCNPAFEDTGNITSSQKGVWAPISLSSSGHAPLQGTMPADCRYVKITIKALAKTNTCAITGGIVRAWTEVRNVSFTSSASDPVISQHPANSTKCVGDQVTMSVTASGPGTLSFQWQKKPPAGSFDDISGAVDSSYTTPALAVGDNGTQYRCRITNQYSSVYSNSAVITVLAPIIVDTIAQAKGFADGTLVRFVDKVVSARTSSAYYVQDSNPPSGIRINSTVYPVPGSHVTVVGTLATTDAGERIVNPSLQEWGTIGAPVRPYFMPTRSIGGSDLNEYAPGVFNPCGPNNIGLLIKIFGTVTSIGPDYYYLDDGVGLRDGTTTGLDDNAGIRIMAPPGGFTKNDRMAVSGLSSMFLHAGKRMRAIVPQGCTSPNSTLPVWAADGTMCAGQSTSIEVGSTEPDVSYQLRNSAGNTSVGSSVTGNGGTISFPTGSLTTTTTYNVLAVRLVGNCSVQLVQTATVTVNALPNPTLAVSATQTQIELGQSANITVANSQTGTSYQLRKNSDNSNVGSPITGTGGMINLPTGVLSTPAVITYNVLATNPTGCSQQLDQTVSITVGSLGTLTGRVLTARMQPISGATVTTSPATVTVTTGADGRYTLVDVPAGTYNIIAAKSGYQTSTWHYVIATAGLTTSVPDKLLPRSCSKIGAHVVMGARDGWGSFLSQTHGCGKGCQMVKMVDDFGAAYDARNLSPETLTVGRKNDTPNYDLQGFDQYADPASPNYTPPAQFAQIIFNELHPYWDQNPQIDVWEICNEWSWWWSYQADFYIAMMDIAEANGHRIAMYGCSAGNPPDQFWPDIARCCARAKAHGGHMLSLHEYSWEGTIRSEYEAHGDNLILRYRRLYNYLREYVDQATGKKVGADCPLVLTEVGNNGGGGFIGDDAFVADMGWYDDRVRQDDYTFGIASWTLGNWSGSNWYTALPEMANYICLH